jgi:hypothetical protein
MQILWFFTIACSCFFGSVDADTWFLLDIDCSGPRHVVAAVVVIFVIA